MNGYIDIWNQARLDRRLGTRLQNHVVEMRMRLSSNRIASFNDWPIKSQIAQTLFTLATSHNRFWPVQSISTLLERWTELTFPERLSCINSGCSRLPVSIGPESESASSAMWRFKEDKRWRWYEQRFRGKGAAILPLDAHIDSASERCLDGTMQLKSWLSS